ncbi:hypothetical protein FBUS_07175 [Fasciolopsis buskii]|uniref:G-protein coupled receptors family 1 profile domain-containing protein n=1 Tax=Fasciolopsis buskii TaxID=27845 RepID=A0A8E0RN80_9TREM|nr:hypothetical protein FBUS_07175 [Fasciolopsis buski]
MNSSNLSWTKMSSFPTFVEAANGSKKVWMDGNCSVQFVAVVHNNTWIDAGNQLPLSLLVALLLIVPSVTSLACPTVLNAKRVSCNKQYFIISVLIAHALYSLSVLPLTIVNMHYGYWPFASQSWCLFLSGSKIAFCAASTYNLAGLSIYRLISITHPHAFCAQSKRKQLFFMISLAWLIPALYLFCPILLGFRLFESDGACRTPRHLWLRVYYVTVGFALPLSVIVNVSFFIFRRLQSQGRLTMNPNLSFHDSQDELLETALSEFISLSELEQTFRTILKLHLSDSHV